MSAAFIRALRNEYPDAQIDAIAKAELVAVAECIGQLNRVIPFSKKMHKGFRGLYRFGADLKETGYDLFFCLPDSFSSAFLGWATGAKQRIGFRKEGRSLLLTKAFKKPGGLHRADEYVSIFEAFAGKKITGRRVELISPPKIARRIIVNFNSEAVSRRMPADKGRSLLQAICTAFPDREIALIGAPNEREHVRQIAAGVHHPQVHNFAGETSFPQLIELIGTAALMLSTDSGPAHLANALGTPVLVLFGAGNEANTAPYNPAKREIIRLNMLPCEPCVKNTCIFGLPKCLQLLDNDRITGLLKQLEHAE